MSVCTIHVIFSLNRGFHGNSYFLSRNDETMRLQFSNILEHMLDYLQVKFQVSKCHNQVDIDNYFN